ncbi:MAG: META domain-containing protein [Bacteroidota bacterium]
MNKFFFLSLFALTSLLACRPEIRVPGGELSQLYQDWTLVGIMDDGDWRVPPADFDPITMRLESRGQAGLQTSCNIGGGDFTANAVGDFQFNASTFTEMYCGELRHEWETLYVESLSEVEQFGLADDRLRLWSDEVSLEFRLE